MNYTVTILGDRSKYGIENCHYDVDIEVDDVRSSILGRVDYSNSHIISIHYKGVDVFDFVLSMINEEDIIFALENGTFEVETNKLKRSIAA